MEVFRLGERIDGGQLAFSKNASGLDILIDKSFDGEDELIMEGRRGLLGKASDIKTQSVGATAYLSRAERLLEATA